MHNESTFRLALAGAIVVCLSPGQALAADGTGGNRLEETVVTASRSLEQILESAGSLSVVTAQDLARGTGYTLAELMRDMPSVQVTDSGQPGLGRVRIRGEESRRTAILVNGQEVTDHFEVGTPLTLHPALVDRIEVLRGSGAVLYGSRALSGVINFMTLKGGSRALQSTVSGGYDSATSGHNLFASVFGNVEGLDYRIAWAESDHEQRATPEGDVENTAFDNNNIYAYMGRTFADHRLEYTYEDYESSSDIFVEEELRTTFPLTDFFLETPRRDRQKHGLLYDWDIGNDWLDSIAASAYLQDSDREFHTITETVWYLRDIVSTSDLETTGALLQLNSQPLGAHHFIVGVQYIDDQIDQTRVVDTLAWAPQAVTGLEQIDDRAAIETLAWFAQDRWEAHETLSITAGLRQYFIEGELQSTTRESLQAGRFDDDNELIAALGAVWSVGDYTRLRVNFAEGYVYPSLAQLATGAFAGSSYVNPDGALTPETSVNVDVGVRLQRRGLMLDVTAFYTESDDYIGHLPCRPQDNCTEAGDRVYLNIGESRAHGIELAISHAKLAGRFEPYASLTWTKRRNEFAEYSTWDSGIPEFSGRLGLRWQGEAAGVSEIWSDIYCRGETGSQLMEPGTSRDTLEDKSGWVTLNAAVGASLGAQRQYQIAAEIVNLADKSYVASTENLPGAERSVALKFTVNL